MSFYEIATLRTVIFGAGKVAPAVEAWVKAPEAKGRLLGAFASDIGALNEVYVLRGFDSLDALAAERDRALRSDNPFGCLEHLVDLCFDSYRPLDFLPPVEPGTFGPFYELRSYKMKLNGLMPTMAKWQGAAPGRSAYSPLTIAMYSLDGAPRLTQLWPYPSLEARASARGQSFADGAWPAKGGPDWLTPAMTSTIAMPLPFSPLQ
jgi:hypothetical protein